MNLKEVFHLLVFNQLVTQQKYKKFELNKYCKKFDFVSQQKLSFLLLSPSTRYSYRVNFHVTYADRIFGRQRAKILNFLPLPLFLKTSPTRFNSFLQSTLFILHFNRDYIFTNTQFLASTYTPFNNEAIKFLSFVQNSQRRRVELNNTLVTPISPFRRPKRRWNLFLKY